jgi:hypothetical protein
MQNESSVLGNEEGASTPPFPGEVQLGPEVP